MSELMELVERVSKAESERDKVKRDLEEAQRALQSQLEALASHNPNLLQNLKAARTSAHTLLSQILPQTQPGSDLHTQILTWIEQNSVGGGA